MNETRKTSTTGARTKKPKRAPRANGGGAGKWDRSIPAPERREAQRRKIIEAATTVIAKLGLAQTAVQDVLDASGVGRRSFYEHFDDLRAVVLAIHTEAAQLALTAVEMAAAAEPDPVQRLRLCIGAFLTLVATNQELARVFFIEIRSLGPEHEMRHEMVLQRCAALLMEGVAQGYGQGIVTRPPDELTAFALIAGFEAIALRYVRRGESHRANEAEEALVELTLRAFR